MELRSDPWDFYDVYVDAYEMRHRVHRFSGTERGFSRANEYARKYNDSLLRAMGISEADLTLDFPDFSARPDEYEQAQLVAMYREHSATVQSGRNVPVVADDDPMPTDYSHDF